MVNVIEVRAQTESVSSMTRLDEAAQQCSERKPVSLTIETISA